MSKEAYIRGWCKAAAANGVDPTALAQLVRSNEKRAGFLDDLKSAWESIPEDQKALVGGLAGTGLGALGGGLAGKLFGFGGWRGALAGAGIGGLGGALYGNSVGTGRLRAAHAKALDDLRTQNENDMGALQTEHAQYDAKREDEHNKALEAQKANTAKQIADMTSKHNKALEAQKADAAKQMAAMTSKHNGAVAGLNGNIKKLQQQLKAVEEAKARAQAAHNEELEMERGNAASYLNQTLEAQKADAAAEIARQAKAREESERALQDQIASLNEDLGSSKAMISDQEKQIGALTGGEIPLSADREDRNARMKLLRPLAERLNANIAEGEDMNLREYYARNNFTPDQIDAIMSRPPEDRTEFAMFLKEQDKDRRLAEVQSREEEERIRAEFEQENARAKAEFEKEQQKRQADFEARQAARAKALEAARAKARQAVKNHAFKRRGK